MKKLFASLIVLIAASLCLVSCEVQNANEVSPQVFSDGKLIDVTGVYRNEANTVIVNPANSGAEIVSLDVRQTGQTLEAIGSNNELFRGSIGNATGGNKVTFTLEGATSTGQKITVNGNISISGDVGTMTGTWIEPTYYATIFAKAIGPSITTNSVNPLQITPNSASIASNTLTQVFTVTGGVGPYSWTSLNTTLGTVSPSSGTSVTYTRVAAGQNTIRVTDNLGAEKTAIISQP